MRCTSDVASKSWYSAEQNRLFYNFEDEMKGNNNNYYFLLLYDFYFSFGMSYGLIHIAPICEKPQNAPTNNCSKENNKLATWNEAKTDATFLVQK